MYRVSYIERGAWARAGVYAICTWPLTAGGCIQLLTTLYFWWFTTVTFCNIWWDTEVEVTYL